MPYGEKTKLLWKNLKYRNHMSKAHKNQIGWNKGLTKTTDVRVKKASENIERRKKISETNKKQYKNGRIPAMLGRKQTQEAKQKLSQTLKKLYKEGKLPTGPNHQWWRGGTQYEPYSANWTKSLREGIKKRDKFKCQLCGNKNNLVVHHINENKKNSNINNLITLCRHCHCKIHKEIKKC